MGLLDQFLKLNPDQANGLLAAGTSIINASGPSRVPVNIMGALGEGMGVYQQSMLQAKRRNQEDEEYDAAKQYRSMQMQGMEAQQEAQRQAAQRALGLQQYNAEFFSKRGKKVDPVASAVSSMSGPTVENAAALSKVQAQPSAQAQQANRYLEELDYADGLRERGYGDQAKEAMKFALEFKPKVKSWEKVEQNGRILLKPYFDDGTAGDAVTADVAEKLEFRDTGQSIDGLNAYTGKVVSTAGKKQTLESIASERTAAAGRAQSDRHFQANYGLAQDRLGLDRKEFDLKTTVGKAPTEFQGKSAAFGLRATEADKIISELTGKYSPAAVNTKQALGKVWGVGGALEAAGNMVLSSEGQRAEQAQRDFVNAVLRQESGAAIGESEFDNARRQYFPQPNDGPAVVAQKARDRKLAIQGLQTNAGRHALTAPSEPQEQPKPAANMLPELPKANKSNQGKVAIDHDTGKRYRSNGLQWVEEK